MKKATHNGECQICGRQQKLPGDLLSKHGYTVRWGFFSGTCPGAGHEPFEVSKSLIQRYRDASAVTASRLRERELSFGAGTLDAELTVARYYGCRDAKKPASLGRCGGYVQERITITRAVKQYGSGEYDVADVFFTDGKKYSNYGTYDNTLRSIRDHNARRCASDASQHDNYVKWQDRRMKDWAPKKLKETAQ